MPITRGLPAGFGYMQTWLTDQSGRAFGTAGPSAAPGTTTHAHLIKEVRTNGLAVPPPAITQFTGGNRWLGAKMWGRNSLDPFDLSMSVFDMIWHALTQGILRDVTTNARWATIGEGVNQQNFPQVGLLMSQYMQSKDLGTDGGDYWLNCLIPRCYIAGRGHGSEYQGESLRTYSVQPTMTSRFPNGVAFGANQGFPGNREAILWQQTDYPLAITTFIGDGTETDFVTAYVPASNVVTNANTPNQFARNNTLQALSSMTPATGTAAMSAAGASGDLNVLIYEASLNTGDLALVA